MTNSKIEKLALALADLTPDELEKQARKSERLNMRVTQADKANMESTADSLGLTLSEYLTALHHYAAPRLATLGRGGARKGKGA